MDKNRGIPPREFDACIRKLRIFFQSKGYIEVYAQNRKSINASCEDPTTLATYNFDGEIWPLPQTSQMELEFELLRDPDAPGFFCVSTSYRNEQDPVPGRHEKIFGMFEFEQKGTMEDLILLERELCEHLGFGKASSFVEKDYDEICKEYGAIELDHDHEGRLRQDHGEVVFIKNFPSFTSPFWNMKKCDGANYPDHARKVDVIINGRETFGSAERSCSPDDMRTRFHTISGGAYAKKLFAEFTKKRVEEELEDFLANRFFTRCGGGIGISRLIKAMKANGILYP